MGRVIVPADPDVWRRTGRAIPACTGPCAQGRQQCPCPQDCRLPETEAAYNTDTDRRLRAWVWRAYLVVLLISIGWGLYALLPLLKSGA